MCRARRGDQIRSAIADRTNVEPVSDSESGDELTISEGRSANGASEADINARGALVQSCVAGTLMLGIDVCPSRS
jgi:hypothetical protein